MSDDSSTSSSSSSHDEQAVELDDVGTRVSESEDSDDKLADDSIMNTPITSKKNKTPTLYIIIASLFTLSTVLFVIAIIISLYSTVDNYTNKAVARQRTIDDFNSHVTDWETTARPAVVSAITALTPLDTQFRTFLATIDGGTVASSLNFSIVTTAPEDELLLNVSRWTLPFDDPDPLTPTPYHLRAIHRFGAKTWEDPSTTDCAFGVSVGSTAPFETAAHAAFATSIQEVVGYGLSGKAQDAVERCERMGGYYSESASVLDCKFRRYLLSICYVVDFETGELSSIEGAPADSHGCWEYQFDPETPQYTEALYGVKEAPVIPAWSEFEVWVELRDRRDPALALNAMTNGRSGDIMFGEDGAPYRRAGMYSAIAVGCMSLSVLIFGCLAICNWIRVIAKCKN